MANIIEINDFKATDTNLTFKFMSELEGCILYITPIIQNNGIQLKKVKLEVFRTNDSLLVHISDFNLWDENTKKFKGKGVGKHLLRELSNIYKNAKFQLHIFEDPNIDIKTLKLFYTNILQDRVNFLDCEQSSQFSCHKNSLERFYGPS